MYAETPRNLVLVGSLGEAETNSLTDYCHRLAAGGQTGIRLDMTTVTDCQRAGLDGLIALLSEDTRMRVTVSGVHWSQFMVMLSEAPVSEVRGLCDAARDLIARSAVAA